MKVKFLATVKNQKLTFLPGMAALYYSHLKTLEGKEIEISIGKRKRDRSNQQNKFYWAVPVRILADSLGYDDLDMHYALRQKFLSRPDDAMNIPRSTTELSTVEFNDYIEQVQRWAAQDLGIVIPDPSEIDLE